MPLITLSSRPKGQKKKGFLSFGIEISFPSGKFSSRDKTAVGPTSPSQATSTQSTSQNLLGGGDTAPVSQQVSTINHKDDSTSGIVGRISLESAESSDNEAIEQNDPPVQTASISFFERAQNLSFYQPNMYDVQGDQTVNTVIHTTVNKRVNNPTFIANLTQNFETQGGMALFFLDQKRVPGAEFNSSARDPPPRCHPETRKELREKLEVWLRDAQRRQTLMIWLTGPAGAGKTAVAQTFAEYCSEQGALGAAFFFSEFNQRAGSHGFIPTIAHQLARQHAGYKQLITRILSEDSSILDQTLCDQFRKLVSDPFDMLAVHDPTPPGKPLVIIIDGLDECTSKQAQSQIIWLVGKYASSAKAKSSPFLWLVCSRPQCHIKAAFAPYSGYALEAITSGWRTKKIFAQEAEWRIEYTREDVTCDDEKDAEDVYIILKDGLQGIHNKSRLYSGRPPRTSKPWPLESDLRKLSHCISGLPVLAATVIRFIGDGNAPEDQLKKCLLSLQDLKARTRVNPLEGLDTIYKHIMDRISRTALDTAKLIISFCLILSTEKWSEKINTALDVRIFLGLDEDNFYCSLEGLHSVLNIPLSDTAHEKPIQFFHKSFGEYLQTPSRAGEYALNLDEARLRIAEHAIRLYGEITQSNCRLTKCDLPHHDDLGPLLENADEDMDWYEEDQLVPHAQLRRFVRVNFWYLLCVGDTRRGEVIEMLRNFEFCHLPFVPINDGQAEGLPRFMDWMSKAMDESKVQTILRLKPMSETDDVLLKQCLKEPPLRKRFPKSIDQPHQYTYSFITSHRPLDRDVPESTNLTFWIGEGERAALGLMYGGRDFEDD